MNATHHDCHTQYFSAHNLEKAPGFLPGTKVWNSTCIRAKVGLSMSVLQLYIDYTCIHQVFHAHDYLNQGVSFSSNCSKGCN